MVSTVVLILKVGVTLLIVRFGVYSAIVICLVLLLLLADDAMWLLATDVLVVLPPRFDDT